MLCMHELAFTRSEPEAKMNAIHCKPKALEVQYRGAWGSVLKLFKKSTFFRELSIFLKCSAQMPTLGSGWHEAGPATEELRMPGYRLALQPRSPWVEFVTRRSAAILLVGFKKSNIT